MREPYAPNVAELPPQEDDEPRFGLIRLDALVEQLTGADYLIKPLFERNCIGTVYGESDAYKSFIMVDVALHLATGTPYHGHNVQQCPVVYIAGEGHGGLGRRVSAWLVSHCFDPKGVPFYLSTVPAELIEQGNALEIARIIECTCPQKPGLIVIDTLSTNIGDGDESDNRDISRLLANVNVFLRITTGACVAIVAHVGHADKERERGGYALRGNVDFRILVRRDGSPEDRRCSIHCRKTKDGPPFPPMAFQANVVALPGVFDSEGEQATSLVLHAVDYVPAAEGKALPEKTEQCLVILRDLHDQAAANLVAGGYSPDGARVESGAWFEECTRRAVIRGKNSNSQRSQFRRIKGHLKENGLIFTDKTFVWPLVET